jgi:alanyl-tRNA synthetase
VSRISDLQQNLNQQQDVLEIKDRRIADLESSSGNIDPNELLETERKQIELIRQELSAAKHALETERQQDQSLLQSLRNELENVSKKRLDDVLRLQQEKEALEEEVKILTEEKQDVSLIRKFHINNN